MKSADKIAMIRRLAKRQAGAAATLADAIADLAEPGFAEFASAKRLTDYLSANGFTCTYPWPHNPTAFRAVRGDRGPHIGLLAEYDALPDCGPRPGAFGHGCGHNLIGTAAAVGAVIASQALAEHRLPGRIVVWGCPAEELLAGKAYMARDGAFRDNDAILCWHPGSNQVNRKGGAALDSLLFEFRGKTAHAAAGPHLGFSALDGVMLMDVAVNYLREHVPENVRIHMCIRHGGDAPNVVPAYAKSWYFIRGRDRQQVDEVRSRLLACAKGAALATGTTVKHTLLTAIYPRLENEALACALAANLQLLGAVKPTAADRRDIIRLGRKPNFDTQLRVAPRSGEQPSRASSDEDTVSWLAPLGRFGIACASHGTVSHNRDYAALMKLPYAHRGALRAAELFAATAWDLCSDRRLLARVRAEFKQRTAGFKFDPLLPARQPIPPANP